MEAIALLSAVSEETLEKTLRMIRRAAPFMALEEMQKKSLPRVWIKGQM